MCDGGADEKPRYIYFPHIVAICIVYYIDARADNESQGIYTSRAEARRYRSIFPRRAADLLMMTMRGIRRECKFIMQTIYTYTAVYDMSSYSAFYSHISSSRTYLLYLICAHDDGVPTAITDPRLCLFTIIITITGAASSIHPDNRQKSQPGTDYLHDCTIHSLHIYSADPSSIPRERAVL